MLDACIDSTRLLIHACCIGVIIEDIVPLLRNTCTWIGYGWFDHFEGQKEHSAENDIV